MTRAYHTMGFVNGKKCYNKIYLERSILAMLYDDFVINIWRLYYNRLSVNVLKTNLPSWIFLLLNISEYFTIQYVTILTKLYSM